FLLSGPDIAFWLALGLILVANSLYEAKYGRDRSGWRRSWSVLSSAPLALRTAGTFALISVLWSLWSSPSLSAWLALWPAAGVGGDARQACLPGLLVAGVAVEESAWRWLRQRDSAGRGHTRPAFLRVAGVTGASILL